MAKVGSAGAMDASRRAAARGPSPCARPMAQVPWTVCPAVVWPFRRPPRPKAPKDRPFATRDGNWVRSLGEQKVADFLSRRGLAYEYEPPLAGLRPDFVLPEHKLVIEYWGGAGFAKYAQRMATKTARYEAEGYDVVHLVPLHLRELERVLRDELGTRGIL